MVPADCDALFLAPSNVRITSVLATMHVHPFAPALASLAEDAPLFVAAQHAGDWFRTSGGIHHSSQLHGSSSGKDSMEASSVLCKGPPPACFPATTDPTPVYGMHDTRNTLPDQDDADVNVRCRPVSLRRDRGMSSTVVRMDRT